MPSVRQRITWCIASLVLLVAGARQALAQAAPRATAPTTTGSAAPLPHVTLPFDSLRASIDRALIDSKPAAYARALTLLDSALAVRPDDAVLLHYRGFLLYREGSMLAASKRDAARAKSRLEEAERALARSAESLPWPETLALQSAVVGQQIGLGGAMAAMRLGAKSSRLLDAALAAGPRNPRVWMLKGVSDLHRPRLFGGSPEKAEASLKKAIALFAADSPTPPAPWWGHAEAYGWLGQVYQKQGRLEEAEEAFAKALTLQPGNAWVLELLLPQLRDKTR
ncbi:MAG: tetratricopeptide repeat protein [Gemmatimonadaceae bacterium]|nr:tetratricopeptide repeat protein [Gemmatimonadaceae bacterium]